MTPEAQRIAIAEACPHVAYIDGSGSACWKDKTETAPGSYDGEVPSEFDPLNDLNAMHEAEMALTDEQMSAYGQRLADMISPEDWDERLEAFVSGGYGLFAISTATAAQRAEAFLRTIGKWEDK